MNTNFTLTQSYLHQTFDYDNGSLIYKTRPSKCVKIGDITSGYQRKDGYKTITIQYKPYYFHRVVFLMQTGYLPDFIDHIDNNKANNKIENLRPCTAQQNCQNKQGITKNKNISWSKNANKWKISFRNNGKLQHYGYFKDLDEAINKASEIRNNLHKEFSNG